MSVLTNRIYPRIGKGQAGINRHQECCDRLSSDYGRARQRQMLRQRLRRWLGRLGRLTVAAWLLAGALMPIVVYQYTNTRAAAIENVNSENTQARLPGNNPILAIPVELTRTNLAPTATSTATSTPTQLPTPTATPTPLPARLIQATAWQATLDQAAGYSHATQTQAAGQYAATQTALPPILTANAQDRAGTATAIVK